ncbi:epoxide hydrolase family protein [Rhizorhabdus dicambivorans]|uniref:Enterotoxin n=1 Tax=Rhizorhabdus dicambivorans TaxID=1850238 RepID=A0A2A4FS51_9SPHN|nr:epoxide hydrolase family protein [Rhizorhabdus dicambivorans]ATE63958.1 enterotoxin [Rhizorhabdus dicambivorans]PCE41565.1 enterotoxin [Rhizorhabdus dicambivorans]
MAIEPFRIDIPQAKLDRIAAKLALSEVGYAPEDDADWRYGTDARWLAGLLDHWRTRYDWRRCEARLNALPHFRTRIDGIDIHFIHVRGTGPARPFPLLLTHGWPGSVLEFLGVIEPLSAMGFDLVIPSLPGYGFSGRPPRPIGPAGVARLWRKLMTEALGYQRFGAQGGDWGSAVTAALGADHGDVLSAIHLNLFMAPPSTEGDDAETTAYRQALAAVQLRESAYMMQHATKPQTIGLALADSPIGFAAWVCEKFHGWGDTGGDIESRFSKDWLLDNIMVYLVNDAVQSAIWMYHTIFTEARPGRRIEVPTGLALYPREFMPYPPRSAAERAYAIADWQEMEAGGHFAALEEPAAFAANVGRFFAQISQG